jgi:Protein of unknown function (DUF3253)
VRGAAVKPSEPVARGADSNSDLNSDLGADRPALQAAIFHLLAKRQSGATICPSDAARAVHPTAAAWRAAMPAVRAVAAQLVAQGKLVVTQGGKEVDIRAAKGPIRLKLPPVDGK